MDLWEFMISFFSFLFMFNHFHNKKEKKESSKIYTMIQHWSETLIVFLEMEKIEQWGVNVNVSKTNVAEITAILHLLRKSQANSLGEGPKKERYLQVG